MGGLMGGKDLFLNVSCGRLINKKKEISFFAYEGTLMDIHQEMDEFEGKQISKIKLKMKDTKSDEIAVISFSEESWFSQGFFSRISKVNLSKPFVLGVSGSDQNEKVSFCWMKQSGYVNPDPAAKKDVIDADKNYARPTKSARGKDNYDALIDASTKTLEEIKQKLDGITSNQIDHSSSQENHHSDEPSPAASEQTDDLPF